LNDVEANKTFLLQVKGLSDSLYIIKVSESSQSIQAILCRGSKFPLTSPKPVPFEVPFKVNETIDDGCVNAN
jgi:hypothetical protein